VGVTNKGVVGEEDDSLSDPTSFFCEFCGSCVGRKSAIDSVIQSSQLNSKKRRCGVLCGKNLA